MAYSLYTLTTPLEWPRRLLHIPSMTSREWKPGNFYGRDKEPGYGIVSYTWGRFEVPEGPRISIEGIDWEIPSIDEDHFTVADMTRLLQHVGLSHEYVWIDIACIDQKRIKVKMEEVGRQAGIFKGARQAYVWLNKYEPDDIRRYMQTLLCCAYDFAIGKLDALNVAEDVVDDISQLLQHPWFSSLWTLQESVLQRHALVLDKRGEPVTTQGPWTGESPCSQLIDVSGACALARTLIANVLLAERAAGLESGLSPHSRKLQDLGRTIDEAGIDFMLCPNPNIQYAAARFRNTSRPEDRIYAIMQVYGYRLGDAATSSRKLKKFSLEDLELQFLKTLNAQSVVLGQAFQHLKVPQPGQSWCITNHVGVPRRLHMIVVHEQFLSSAYTLSIRRKSEAYFQGKACTLHELLGFWKSRRQVLLAHLQMEIDAPLGLNDRNAYFRGNSYRNTYFKEAKHGMILDHNDHFDFTAGSFEWPPDTTVLDERGDPIIECRLPELIEATDKQQALGEAVIESYSGKAIKVLYLGRAKHIELMDVAIIIVHEGTIGEGLMMRKDNIWRRIGLCFWHIEGNRGNTVENALKPLRGKFG